MLLGLHVKNLALIEKAEVEFTGGLNILTGETGAGKSILIDSINAILGNRASKDLVRTGAAKAVIRAAFEDVPPAVLDSLEKAGYERSSAARSLPRARAPAASTGCLPPPLSCGSFAADLSTSMASTTRWVC
mgnify:CR=1 FL=1